MKKQEQYVYFLYPYQQFQERKNIEKSISRAFVPVYVIVKGR